LPLLPRADSLWLATLPVVRSVEEAADTAYAFVIITTKSLPDILPTESMLEPIIKAGKSKTFVLIQVSLDPSEPHQQPELTYLSFFVALRRMVSASRRASTPRLALSMQPSSPLWSISRPT
jgi:hypothetical protein